jgi:hypothetical protein
MTVRTHPIVPDIRIAFLNGGKELLVILKTKVSNRIGARNPVPTVNTSSCSGLKRK